MSYLTQKTIKNKVSFNGVALVSNMSRKILVFKESVTEIDFVPSFNIRLIKKKEKR